MGHLSNFASRTTSPATLVTSTPSPSPQTDPWLPPVDKTVKLCFGTWVNPPTTHSTAWKAATRSPPSCSAQTDTGCAPLADQPSESGTSNKKNSSKSSRFKSPITKTEASCCTKLHLIVLVYRWTHLVRWLHRQRHPSMGTPSRPDELRCCRRSPRSRINSVAIPSFFDHNLTKFHPCSKKKNVFAFLFLAK